jgi:hypothetical protein
VARKAAGPLGNVAGTGSVGQNGLKPQNYRYFSPKLAKYVNAPLTTTGNQLRADFDDIIKDPSNDAGAEFMGFVIQCAVPSDTQVYYDGGLFADGGGILDTTRGWVSDAGLTPPQLQDLHACLATLLNLTDSVRVWIDGTDISHVSPPDDYTMIEAGWKATVDDAGVPTITVWRVKTPGARVLDADIAIEKIKERICGRDAGACGLKVGDGSCADDGGILLCKDTSENPVTGTFIETRVTCEVWCGVAGVMTSSPSCKCNSSSSSSSGGSTP